MEAILFVIIALMCGVLTIYIGSTYIYDTPVISILIMLSGCLIIGLDIIYFVISLSNMSVSL